MATNRVYDGEREFKLEADVRRLLATEGSARALVRDAAALQRTQRAKKAQRARVNKIRKPAPDLAPGSLVKFKTSPNRPKAEDKWKGPATICSHDGPVTYTISFRGKEARRYRTQLRPYISPISPIIGQDVDLIFSGEYEQWHSMRSPFRTAPIEERRANFVSSIDLYSDNLWAWSEYFDLVRTKVAYTGLGEGQATEKVHIVKQAITQDFCMSLQGRMLLPMRADPDWLVAYTRLYAGVWPKFSKGEKALAVASFARSLRQDTERKYEVLQELIVFMCGRSMLKVLVDEVGDQEKNPSVPVASATDYLAAMQKRLAAYQAGAPVVNLDALEPPRPSGEPNRAMARAISEVTRQLRLAPKTAAEKRKEARRAARAVKKLEAAKQGEQREAGLQSQHLSGLAGASDVLQAVPVAQPKEVGQRGAEIARAASQPLPYFIEAEVDQFCTRYTNCREQNHTILAMADGKIERYLLSQCVTVSNFLDAVS
ncbi:hypothetical protein SARC_11393 [Sphaeroforma arctica JP610]|uniref:Uncharacterized protein n=1 Tax=Sphaeroforma arctica JP610 TaxID=667725 RepID=A0A0L0FH82_9EUKA|nr:hypothetical protein SARC_11393 [Sphaeroforma arctica JP610]KNC76095.1 hypothetical protein SARC_11393 [Sphaeroforma arctica JP610]|eukprot:XP_014149997.1 hypothetical protein SARC_11393 [Sphaeroforma arctica JP610]